MRKLGIFLIIFLAFTFFYFNEKVEAAAVPISYGPFVDNLFNYVQLGGSISIRSEINGMKFDIYDPKLYKDKGIWYWTANFGENKNNLIKFKLNNNNYVDWATITCIKSTKSKWLDTNTFYIGELMFEINMVCQSIVYTTICFDENKLDSFYKIFDDELNAAAKKILEQEGKGKTVVPYDHTSSIYSNELKKKFKVRVYWDDSLIFVAITAESKK